MDRNIPSPPKSTRTEAEDSIFEAPTSPVLRIDSDNVSNVRGQPNAVVGIPVRKLPLEQPFAFDSSIPAYRIQKRMKNIVEVYEHAREAIRNQVQTGGYVDFEQMRFFLTRCSHFDKGSCIDHLIELFGYYSYQLWLDARKHKGDSQLGLEEVIRKNIGLEKSLDLVNDELATLRKALRLSNEDSPVPLIDLTRDSGSGSDDDDANDLEILPADSAVAASASPTLRPSTTSFRPGPSSSTTTMTPSTSSRPASLTRPEKYASPSKFNANDTIRSVVMQNRDAILSGNYDDPSSDKNMPNVAGDPPFPRGRGIIFKEPVYYNRAVTRSRASNSLKVTCTVTSPPPSEPSKSSSSSQAAGNDSEYVPKSRGRATIITTPTLHHFQQQPPRPQMTEAAHALAYRNTVDHLTGPEAMYDRFSFRDDVPHDANSPARANGFHHDVHRRRTAPPAGVHRQILKQLQVDFRVHSAYSIKFRENYRRIVAAGFPLKAHTVRLPTQSIMKYVRNFYQNVTDGVFFDLKENDDLQRKSTHPKFDRASWVELKNTRSCSAGYVLLFESAFKSFEEAGLISYNSSTTANVYVRDPNAAADEQR